MPPFKLDPAELTGIVAFIRAGFDTSASVRVGDAARGRALFQGKGECATCHRVAGQGPALGAGSERHRARARARRCSSERFAIPRPRCMPINRPVRIVMRDGRTIRGRRLNEDTHTVQIIDEQRAAGVAHEERRAERSTS